MIGISTRSKYKQSGTYVIWVLLLLPVLVGALALSFDAGIAMIDHQRARTAADAAALAGAFAVKRDLADLRSADADVKAAAVERVEIAAREIAASNGFSHGDDGVQVTVNYPPSTEQSIYYSVKLADAVDIKQAKSIYLGVTVQRPVRTRFAHLLLPQEELDEFTIVASAVGRAGTTGKFNSCPALYMYGGGMANKKVLDLGKGADFEVLDGGIFINYNSTGTALYGSNEGSSMTAEWIEKSVNAGQTGQVDYFCTKYPADSPCPKPVSDFRYEPEKPPTATCTVANKQCCVRNGYLKCGCSAVNCALNKDTDHAKVCSPGIAVTKLTAGDYCEGLTIYNTGTAASPLILKPTASTNVFNLQGSNMTVLGSYIRAESDPNYDHDGLVIFSYYDSTNPPPSPGAARLEVGSESVKDSRSTIEGKLRLYFDAIWLTSHSTDTTPTKLSVLGFDQEGCGKLPDTNTVVVQ